MARVAPTLRHNGAKKVPQIAPQKLSRSLGNVPVPLLVITDRSSEFCPPELPERRGEAAGPVTDDAALFHVRVLALQQAALPAAKVLDLPTCHGRRAPGGGREHVTGGRRVARGEAAAQQRGQDGSGAARRRTHQ